MKDYDLEYGKESLIVEFRKMWVEDMKIEEVEDRKKNWRRLWNWLYERLEEDISIGGIDEEFVVLKKERIVISRSCDRGCLDYSKYSFEEWLDSSVA